MTNICTEHARQWVPNNIMDTSTSTHVMAWCLTTPSHYLSQCWPSSTQSYGIIRLQWVIFFNSLPSRSGDAGYAFSFSWWKAFDGSNLRRPGSNFRSSSSMRVILRFCLLVSSWSLPIVWKDMNGLIQCKQDTIEIMMVVQLLQFLCTTVKHLIGNKIVDHSDVVGAPPVSAAPTTSSFST